MVTVLTVLGRSLVLSALDMVIISMRPVLSTIHSFPSLFTHVTVGGGFPTDVHIISIVFPSTDGFWLTCNSMLGASTQKMKIKKGKYIQELSLIRVLVKFISLYLVSRCNSVGLQSECDQ